MLAQMHTPPPLQQPPAEVEITVETVRALLQAQHPDLADLPIHPVDAGWDNAVFRVGSHLSARLPRRLAAAALLLKEQTWLPQLAAHLPLPVPNPVRLGQPGVSESTWTRARGWAIFFGVLMADMGLAGNTRHAEAGKLTLRRLVEGP